MATTTPDWLQARGGRLVQDYDGRTVLVLINDTPQYKLTPVPAAGRFACQLVQTVNGKRLETGKNYPTADDAVNGCLEELRSHIGW
jgi:hypothetical protein